MAAGGALPNVDSVGKHLYSSKLEEAVFKATQSKVRPIKQKHERGLQSRYMCVEDTEYIAILIETWNTHGASVVFSELFKRPLIAKSVVLFKALILVHKMLRDGHPKCIDDADSRVSFFESVYAQVQNIPSGYEQISAAYLSFLLNKIKFHKMYPEVGGELSLQKYNDTLGGKKRIDLKRVTSLVQHLLDLQRSVLFFANKTLSQVGLNECKLGGVIPALVESYGAYTMSEALLQKLADNGVSEAAPLIEIFKEVHPVVAKFYFNCSTIPYITSHLSVPVISQTPPSFAPVKNAAPPPKKAKTKRETAPALQAPNPTPLLGADVFGSAFSGGYNPFGSNTASNPFAIVPQQTPNTWFTQPTYTPPTQSLYSDFSSGESKESLERKVRELEAQIVTLKAQLRDRDGQISELQLLLRDRDAGVSQVRTQMEERLKAQQETYAQQNLQMQQHLETMVKQYQADKLALVGEQVELAKGQVEQGLFKFDDPSHMGNRSASSDDVLNGLSGLDKAYANLLNAIENEGDVVGAARTLADLTTRWLDDVKGAASRIEDPALRMQLLETARAMAQKIANLLSHARQLVPEGKPDEGQLAFLRSEQASYMQQSAGVREAVTDSLRALQQDDKALDALESLAERELLNAARQIEEAAANLRRAGEQRSVNLAPGELDVEGSILAAAQAITTATQLLVTSAAQAQQERARKGLLSGDSKYHRDPAWTEGLISAAKAVAESTKQLVGVASKAARGEIDDASLIAAARAVAASTAQLVTATRAKSEPGAPTQQALDQAAAAVTRATKALVDAAKSYRSTEEMAMLRKTDSFASSVRAEIEQQAEIIRLEQQLDLQRKKLFTMRKDKYTDAHEAAAAASASPRPVVVNTPSRPPLGEIDTSSAVTGFKPEREKNKTTSSSSSGLKTASSGHLASGGGARPAPTSSAAQPVNRGPAFATTAPDSDSDDSSSDDEDVPAYMKKLSAPKKTAAPPDLKTIPKFWQNKGGEAAGGPTSPTAAEQAPKPTAKPAPTTSAPTPVAEAPAAWNPFAAPSSSAPASNPFGGSAPQQISHNPFL